MSVPPLFSLMFKRYLAVGLWSTAGVKIAHIEYAENQRLLPGLPVHVQCTGAVLDWALWPSAVLGRSYDALVKRNPKV